MEEHLPYRQCENNVHECFFVKHLIKHTTEKPYCCICCEISNTDLEQLV